ncbi:MAG: CinA family protein [Clostridia bacterium]|nr:CinA family protein [Clostridia bacterium]
MSEKTLVFKAFGYDEEGIKEKLASLSAAKSLVVVASCLDAKIEIVCEEVKEVECYSFVYNALKGAIYADEDITIAEAVLDRLALYGKKLSVAESLTGGLVTDRLVSIPGASEVLIEGLVTYANESKINRLGVNEFSIRAHGAVSSDVAKQMAQGLIAAGADFAVSTTGIAGPSGGTKEKPVGLTYIGVADENGVSATECLFEGDRSEIRNSAANAALFLLWKKIVKPNDFDTMVIE